MSRVGFRAERRRRPQAAGPDPPTDRKSRVGSPSKPSPAAQASSARWRSSATRSCTTCSAGRAWEPLSHVPFESPEREARAFRPDELGWRLAGEPVVRFLPCLGGFVGSDILAGALAVGMHQSDELIGLIDLGTNGEIVLRKPGANCLRVHGRRTGLRGRPYRHGHACRYRRRPSRSRPRAGGSNAASWAAASRVASAAAGWWTPWRRALDLGWIEPNGRFAAGRTKLELHSPVFLAQRDVRELQLAKAAVAAGVRILLERLGGSISDVSKLYLAGAFGNYVGQASARRIGLLRFPEAVIESAGNTALLGAKIALFSQDADGAEIRGHPLPDARHVLFGRPPAIRRDLRRRVGLPPKTPSVRRAPGRCGLARLPRR